MLLRPIFCEKLKIAPHKKTAPPETFEFRISAEKNTCFWIFFFLETTWFWAEKTFKFQSFPRNFVWIFGQTVWNWFKNNQNSGQGRLHFSLSFKIAPPPFSKSWLRAWSLWCFSTRQVAVSFLLEMYIVIMRRCGCNKFLFYRCRYKAIVNFMHSPC